MTPTTRITCNCPEHNGTSATIRTPDKPLTDSNRIHHLVRIAHHPLWSKASSTVKFGPWKD